MPKVITPPSPENTLTGNEVFVKPLYARATNIHKLFDFSQATTYNILNDYKKDDKGIKDLYISYSATMCLIDIEKFIEFLKTRHKKHL